MLLTSGHSEEALDLTATAPVPFLEKPFTPAEYLGRIRGLLDA